MKNTPRPAALAAALTISLLTSACASTSGTNGTDATYPDNLDALTVIVPFAPGGTTDTIARLLAPALESELDVPVQVLNRPERDGQAGFDELADSPTDGSVVGFTNLPSAVTTYVGTGGVDFDADDFEPVGGLTSLSTVVAVHEDSQYDDFGDLVQAATAKPKGVTLAAGALDDRIQVSQIEQATGAEFNKIPFEGGSSGEVTALLGRKVDAIIGAPVAMIPNVQSGEFKVVAVFGPERIEALPDSPTALEQDVDLEMESRIGLSLPAGTDRQVSSTLQEALEAVSNSPEFTDAVEALGYGGGWVTPDQYVTEWSQAEKLAQTVVDRESQ